MAMLSIPNVKGKSNIEIDSEKLPNEVYEEALKLGLKVLVNRGMSKVTKAAHPEEAELLAKANEIGAKNLEAIYAGKIKFSGGKSKSAASGVVMVEARRIAKALVKDGIKAAGGKISHYPAAEITKAANALIQQDPSIIETAKANLEERAKTKVAVNVMDLVKADPALVAKAEAKKAEAKADGLSAKQAGKSAPRGKKGNKTAQPSA